MGRYFRTIYLYIVAFATLCMVVAGFVGTVNSAVAYQYPVINEYEIEGYYDKNNNGTITNTEYLIKKIELERVQKRTSLKEAFTYLAVLASGLPLYVFHVKQIKKESEKEV